MAYFLGVRVKEIDIYPLGGISKFDMDLNINPKKELLILLWGPLFQVIAYYLLSIIWVREQELVTNYHLYILIFNLLPIYPLDGGKILLLWIEKIFPYKKSLKIGIYISYGIVLLIFLRWKRIQINHIIMIGFCLFLIRKEEQKINYYHQKFILERFLKKYQFQKTKIVRNLNQFYRNRKHIIREENDYYQEEEYFMKKYKK